MNFPAASFQTIRQMAGPLRTVPLPAVLRILQARPDRRDKRKWHTAQGTLSVNGAKFINWSCGRGGGGAIDLVMHLNRCDFKQAVQWLARHFTVPAGLADLPPDKNIIPACPPVCAQRPARPGLSAWDAQPGAGKQPQPAPSVPALRLPPPAPNRLWRVRCYLVLQRGLASDLIDSLIHSGLLYADSRANAVFPLFANENLCVGAELRGTNRRPWYGLAAGSQKDLGFFSVASNPVQAIILCESAIDAMSCLALHPRHHCISTAGARSNPPWLPSLLDRSLPVFCGFDADPTGDDMAQAMITFHPAIQRLRPPQHDWNDVLRASS